MLMLNFLLVRLFFPGRGIEIKTPIVLIFIDLSIKSYGGFFKIACAFECKSMIMIDEFIDVNCE